MKWPAKLCHVDYRIARIGAFKKRSISTHSPSPYAGLQKALLHRQVSPMSSTCASSRRLKLHSEFASRQLGTPSIVTQRGYEAAEHHSKRCIHTPTSGQDVVDPTIYALSTASGRAAIAIIRCSGPLCLKIYKSLCPGKPAPKPRMATLRALYRPHVDDRQFSDGTIAEREPEILDPGALVLYFPAPHTVTGEDVLEFHVHGGPAVVRAVLQNIPLAIPTQRLADDKSKPRATIRYAEPGEFTRRAFANARLSLPQVEALAAALSADTAQQHRAAMAATNGAAPLTALYKSWETYLIAARGELEALIDFAEDQAFDEHPEEFLTSISSQIQALLERLTAHSAHAGRGELIRDGATVALLGPPNAGKSSLLNAVVGRAAAIVSPEPGTTRDVLDVSVDIGGYAFRFGDLAGLRGDGVVDTTTREPVALLGAVEREGIRRAKARTQAAQIVVAVIPVGENREPPALGADVAAALADLDPARQRLIIALNKTDLLLASGQLDLAAGSAILRSALPPAFRAAPVAPISCLNDRLPQGIQPLLNELMLMCKDLTSISVGTEIVEESVSTHTFENGPNIPTWDLGPASLASLALGSSERQRALLDEACSYLHSFLDLIGTERSKSAAVPQSDGLRHKSVPNHRKAEDIDVVLAAEHLRGAANCLARVSGRGESGDVEEVLGVVFEKFCVGK